MLNPLAVKYIKSFNQNMIDKDLIENQLKLEGLSGAGTAQVISKCVSLMNPGNQYLEVGIYQGANLVTVASKNKTKTCLGVDLFCQAFQENKNYPNLTTEQVVQKRIKDYGVEENCSYIKSDFREFLKTSPLRNVEIYFFDGPHELEDQIDGVEMALPLLTDHALIFVDDLVNETVQESSRTLVEKYKELTVVRELLAPGNHRQWFNQGQIVFEYRRSK